MQFANFDGIYEISENIANLLKSTIKPERLDHVLSLIIHVWKNPLDNDIYILDDDTIFDHGFTVNVWFWDVKKIK